MNTPPRPPLEGQRPAAPGPRAAEPSLRPVAVGDRKGAARQGVLSALPAEPDVIRVTGIQPGLQVRFTHPPVADWLCACGHHERASGRAAVIELTTRVRVGVCPHSTNQEGRAAA